MKDNSMKDKVKPYCQLHLFHSPHVAEIQVHHMIPKSWGGLDIPNNRLWVCPTGHCNVHQLLNDYIYAQRNGLDGPEWKILEHFGKAERDLCAKVWAETQGSIKYKPKFTLFNPVWQTY